MDILLTHGYFLFEDPVEKKVMKPYPPLGILYISSYLKSKGFEVEVLDTTFRLREEVFDLIEQKRPSLVGIYCNMMTKFNVLAMIQHCKQLGSTVILGGPEPINYQSEYLKFGADIIVSGEGEHTLEALIPHLARYGKSRLEQIEGIAFLEDEDRVCQTPERPFFAKLDELPFPDRNAIDLKAYLETWQTHHNMSAASLITARGCPYKCTWCSHSVFGFSHRRRSPQNVADEVDQVVSEYKPDMLWYADDVFTIHRAWFFEYASELKKRDLQLPFECISREDRLDEEVIKALAQMGCFRLWIGSESGSQRILDAMQRKTDAIRVRAMTRLLQKYGIEAGMFIMLGYEGERQSDLQDTVTHLKEANPDIFLTTVSYPIKGTQYYEEIENRIRRRQNWAESTDRDLQIAERHSSRYYQFANRWMVNEVNLHRQRNNGSGDFLKNTKTFLNAKLGRLGMALTR